MKQTVICERYIFLKIAASVQKLGEWNVNDDSDLPVSCGCLHRCRYRPVYQLILIVLFFGHIQEHALTHIHMSAWASGAASIFIECETLTCPICVVWGRREKGITWRIISGDKLPLQTWLHWFGQSVCGRESNSDRSQHFTNGPSKHLNKTLCTGAALLGKAIKSQISSKWLMQSVSV